LNELEIWSAEELEELQLQQKLEEFELTAKFATEEQELTAAADLQRTQLESAQLQEKQKTALVQMQRSQRKQMGMVAKSRRAAIRIKEKMLVGENPVMQSDLGSSETVGFANDGMSCSGSISGLSEGTNASAFEDGTDELSVVGGPKAADGGGGEDDNAADREAQINAMANKTTRGGSGANADGAGGGELNEMEDHGTACADWEGKEWRVV
ncbi:hypothetical protein HK405_001258, partial [Cladochytrium tenue]